MNKYIKLSLISLLCVSLLVTNVIANEQRAESYISQNATIQDEIQSISPDQFGEEINYSRPILDKVTYQINDSTPEVDLLKLVERNETTGTGAIFQAIVYTNITVYYKVLNGTENTAVYLHTNEPTLDSNFDVNNNSVAQLTYVSSVDVTDYELPYSGEVFNGSLATYKLTFNLTREYVNFFARAEALSENQDNSPMNLLSVGQFFSVEFTEEFYIQNENVTLSLTAGNVSSTDVYGFKYKTKEQSLYTEVNFTTTVTGTDANGSYNLGTYEPGTVIEVVALAFLNDTTTKEFTRIANVIIITVDVGDGTPSLDLDILKNDNSNTTKLRQVDNVVYTQSRDIQLKFNASVVKGKVVRYAVNYTDGVNPVFKNNVSFTEVNGSHVVKDNFTATSDGQWNVTVFAFTDKGLSVNETFSLYIDTTNPTVSISGPSSDVLNPIVSDTLEVTFNFTIADELSGVYYASLDLGDNTTVEVTGMDSYTYVYITEGTYTVVLTVVDNAGNEQLTIFSVTVQYKELEKVYAPAPFLPFLGALVLIPILRRKD